MITELNNVNNIIIELLFLPEGLQIWVLQGRRFKVTREGTGAKA